MSSIGSISGVNGLSYQQPVTGTFRRGSDGDDGAGNAGDVGKSNFMNAIAQALGQSVPGSTAGGATNSAQDPQVALQSFMRQNIGNGQNISCALLNTTA